MNEKYLVEVWEGSYPGKFYEKKDGQYTAIEHQLTCNYPIDKEIIACLKEIVKQQEVFISSGDRVIYKISDDLGEIFKLLIAIFLVIFDFRTKLRFVDQTQILSLLEQGDLETLKERLSVFLLAQKISKP